MNTMQRSCFLPNRNYSGLCTKLIIYIDLFDKNFPTAFDYVW